MIEEKLVFDLSFPLAEAKIRWGGGQQEWGGDWVLALSPHAVPG